MNETVMLNHIRKVNKSITGILFLLAVISIGAAIFFKLPSMFFAALFFVITALVAVYSISQKKFEVLLSYIVSFSISCCVIAILSGGTSIYIILVPLSITALYLNFRILLYNSILVNIAMLAKLIITSAVNKDVIVQLIITDTIAIIIMFLCKAGRSLITEAARETELSAKSLQELNTTMDTIDTNTLMLNGDISNTYGNLQAVKEISNSMVVTVQEVVIGITNEAESVDQIYNMINTADEKSLEAQRTSDKLKEISVDAAALVNNGSDKIKQMNQQMEIISHAVTESVDTVRELQDNMAAVNDFLSNIINISQQTNLLSLNASIEAARAGEAGRGFTVVADEVRKLADQSARTVNQINEIAENINVKMQLVLDKVQNGNNAVRTGAAIVNEVDLSFNQIRNSFNDIDGYILTVQEMVQKTTEIFNKIRNESEGLASIAEEHSAATQEMLSTMEEHNESINRIYELMKKITESSENLRGAVRTKQDA